MSSLQKYRDILCVDKDANVEQIKKSYKKEAMRWHPDRNNGDDSRFKKITEAYEKLIEITNNPQPKPIFKQFQSMSDNSRSFYTENIYKNTETGSRQFVDISNGTTIIYNILNNLKTGTRTEFTF
jgi:DnaJ-class molecular chaperone